MLTDLAFFDHHCVFRSRLDVVAHRRVDTKHLRFEFARLLHMLAGYARLPVPSPPRLDDLPQQVTHEDLLRALGGLGETVYATRLCVRRRDISTRVLVALCEAFERAVWALDHDPSLPARSAAGRPDTAAAGPPDGQHGHRTPPGPC